jgi:hypothetical protein
MRVMTLSLNSSINEFIVEWAVRWWGIVKESRALMLWL